MPPSQYDDVFVISDLHMGGRPGTQIFKHDARLGAFFKKLAEDPQGRNVALVLNGDVIDSLAEDLPGYVAMTEIDIDALLADVFANFPEAWEGMSAFACAPGRHLVIVIGNHDIELALAPVQRRILSKLAEGHADATPSVTFCTDGRGFTCQVGRSTVHCTHGNEQDAWNLVDYDQLHRLDLCLENGEEFPRSDWSPNSGTRLVKDVMNEIKEEYPFVDLLKPETKPVLGVLLTLKPELVKGVTTGEATHIGLGLVRGVLERAGLLSVDAESVDQVTDPRHAVDVAVQQLLGPRLAGRVDPRRTPAERQLLLELEAYVRAGKQATQLVEAETTLETLGFIQMFIDRMRGIDKVESLREALLDWSGDDQKAFRLSAPDDLCKRLNETLPKAYDFIVAGHTHLERAVPIGRGRFYYNCGTWIRLMRLPKSLLEVPEEFARVYRALGRDKLVQLDEEVLPASSATTPQPLILDVTAAVQISTEGQHTVGRLLRVLGSRDDVRWEKLPETEFRK